MDATPSGRALGILYAEDFGQPPPSPTPEPVFAPPSLTQADIDAACIRAVQAAEIAWSGSAAERRAEALAALAASLGDARAEAAARAEEVADGLARAALGALASVLPHASRKHGDAEVRVLLHRMLPLIAAQTRVVVRVHAGLIEALQQDLAQLDDLAGQIELRPANLPPGDTRLSWDDGGLVRDSAAICAAMIDGLAQLGLVDPPSPTPHTKHEWSPALAQ